MRIIGWLAMVIAVLGVVLSLLLAGGVWLVRPEVEERVDAVIAAGQDALGKAGELVVSVNEGVGQASARAAEVEAQANEVAQNGPLEQLLAALRSRIEDLIGTPYQDVRSRYAAFRERVFAVADALDRLDKALPGVELPGVVIDAFESIDQRLVEFDTRVSGLSARLDELAEPRIAPEVAQIASEVQAELDAVQDRLAAVGESIDAAEARLAQLEEDVAQWLTIGSVVVTILGLYLAGLHVLLFRQGQRWAGTRSEAASGTAMS
jgi:uncharacterized protein involved in exopolysaccharide biosynthesis